MGVVEEVMPTILFFYFFFSDLKTTWELERKMGSISGMM